MTSGKLNFKLTVLFSLLKTLHPSAAGCPTTTLTLLGSRSSNIGGGDVGSDGGCDGGGDGDGGADGDGCVDGGGNLDSEEC